ncbi:MAG: DNA-directed RNA polymerase subunit alpha [Caldiserica bacterium]|nr:MAG: DNA-directed RNA polymerase subunit alpha [Caldisericota bacterium]
MEYLSGRPKVKVLEEKENYLKFVVDPLYRGYGITLGNALRRVLLSSIRGYGIYAVEISGITHEFTSIPHVYEDVPEIIFNLKQVIIKGSLDRDKLHLKVKGEKEVKASDFDPNPNIEIVNPDQHLFTITDKKGEVEITAYVKRGFGYNLESENKEKGFPINTIFMDTIFSPIRKVNFEVSSSDVAPFPKREKLVMEIYTNGAINPRKALKEASEILKYYMGIISEFKEEEVKKELSVELLPIPSRIKNVLRKEGIETVTQLKKLVNSGDIKDIRGIGEKSIEEIREVLFKTEEAVEEPSFFSKPIDELMDEFALTDEELMRLKEGGIKTLKDLLGYSASDLLSDKFELPSKRVKRIENKLRKWNLFLRKEKKK